MAIPSAPAGFSTVNPFIVTRDAEGLIRFLTEVFGGVEHPDARTMDHDGLLLHAELQVGDTTIMFAERKPGWPFTPSLLQVYVEDVEATLARAESRGGEVVTRPTDFFGFHVFSRFLDPWRNLWWVYDTQASVGDAEEPGADTSWDAGEAGEGEVDERGGEWQPTEELTYIHDTLIEAFPRLRDPHS
jgi:PhnB protein